jgi:23S rRNA pseudouridine2605 synthase
VAEQRLQKIIAAAGIASRRKAEELITSGQVAVNGQIVTQLGAKADPDRDHIRVGSRLLRAPERHVYLMLNKPRGYVTTVTDPEGRPTVMDLVRSVRERVYPVGRLDYGSEGLLLMTNDGELAHALTRTASHVEKTYLVKVSGKPTAEAIGRLRAGIALSPRLAPKGQGGGDIRRRTAPAGIRIVRESENPWLEVTLIEGRNRQLRRMFEQVGHHVEKIRRVRYGPLELDVEPGKFRPLDEREVARLKAAASGAPAPAAGGARSRRLRFAAKRQHGTKKGRP